MLSAMVGEKDAGLVMARKLARSGEYSNWHGVETRLQELGILDSELLFSRLIVRGEIDAICQLYFRRPFDA